MEVKTSIISNGKVVVFEGAPETATFDLSGIPTEVIDGMALGFMQRVFRERTAGKVDSAEDRKAALKSIAAQHAAWCDGKLETERAAKVTLTDDETAAATLDFIVVRKRFAGDTRPEAEIKALFSKLAKEKQAEILTALAKPHKKFLAERLKVKRGKGPASW